DRDFGLVGELGVLVETAGDPVEEVLLAALDAEGEDLRQLVAVELLERLFEGLVLGVQGLDQEHVLAVAADLSLPAIERTDTGDDGHAPGAAARGPRPA